MKREYFAFCIIMIIIAIKYGIRYFFKAEYEDYLSSIFFPVALIAFYLGQYSMKLPKSK